jgi:hypothetical protein
LLPTDVGTIDGFYPQSWMHELGTSERVKDSIKNRFYQPDVLVCGLQAAGFEEACCTSRVFVHAQLPETSMAGAQVTADAYIGAK